ncbi:MAG: CHAT domain-containing protein [Anaerolineae bacterium]|nr:CHAT domain-containing protein [Anaerolineae bacterium]
MSKRAYLTLDLLIERAGDSYRALIVDSPVGQANAAFASPFQPPELDSFMARIGRRAPISGANATPEEMLKQFGKTLFNAVFHDEVLTSFRRSRDAADNADKGLRIKLRLDEVPELADLPWEYLYDATRENFLALSRETPIVRFLALPEPVEPLAAPSPLNLLAVLASPTDYETLDVQGEWRRLQDATLELRADNKLTLTRVEPPTFDALQRQLRKGDYHLLHFIGHGEYDAATQHGALVFEDAQKQGRAVRDELVATLLHDADSMRVVLLNACEGARTSAKNPFTGVAPRLVQKGIPAVIAMQFPISDPAAILFSSEVYRTLADGFPMDAAVNEARRAIYFGGSVLEWGTPVLFMRAADGTIFAGEDEMADEKKSGKSGGGINIGGNARVSVGRDMIGGDKNVQGDDIFAEGDINTVTIGAGATVGQVAAGRNNTQINQGADLKDLAALFQTVYKQVDARPDDPDIDKDEIKAKVKQVESEANKGEQANAKKIERWLTDLKNIAPDILEITAAALLNPIAGVALAVAKIAERFRTT